MLKAIKPKIHLSSIYEIDLREFWLLGYRNMIIDVDNTITKWNNHVNDKRLKDWFILAKSIGFDICLLSNNRKTSIISLAKELEVLAVLNGGKPFRRGFDRALAAMSAKADTTLLIGDQIFTDILGGNKSGLYTILVDPISNKEFIGTKITRLIERIFGRRRADDK